MSDHAKRRAGERAVNEIENGQILGLGTGSTIGYVLYEIAARLKDGRLRDIAGVPTSERTAAFAGELGIPLTTLTDHPHLDLALDGADEISPQLDLIKGLGGALLREKIVATAARALVIVADAGKLVSRLGEKAPVPVEIVPFALGAIVPRLSAFGDPMLRCRSHREPFVTDEGNYIVDLRCGPIADPAALDLSLRRIPGVVDHGLFLGLARRAIIATDDGLISVLESPAINEPID